MDDRSKLMLLSVAELKDLLRDNELPVSGNKSVLVDRILENLNVEFEEDDSDLEEIEKEKLVVEQSLTRQSPTKKQLGLEQMPTELYYKMAESMKISEVFNLCLVSKGFDRWICKQESFWKKRLLDDFAVKYGGENPRQEYQRLYDGGFIIDSISGIRNEIYKKKASEGKYDPLENLIKFTPELKALFTAYTEEKDNSMTTAMKEEYIDMQAGKNVPYVMTLYIKLRIGLARFFSRLSKIPINKFTIDQIQNVEAQPRFGAAEYISIRTLDEGWDFSKNIFFSKNRYKGFELSIVFDRQRRQLRVGFSDDTGRSIYPEKGKNNPLTFEIISFIEVENRNRGLFHNLMREWSSLP